MTIWSCIAAGRPSFFPGEAGVGRLVSESGIWGSADADDGGGVWAGARVQQEIDARSPRLRTIQRDGLKGVRLGPVSLCCGPVAVATGHWGSEIPAALREPGAPVSAGGRCRAVDGIRGIIRESLPPSPALQPGGILNCLQGDRRGCREAWKRLWALGSGRGGCRVTIVPPSLPGWPHFVG